jgi:hypothetical protein
MENKNGDVKNKFSNGHNDWKHSGNKAYKTIMVPKDKIKVMYKIQQMKCE